MRVEQATAYVLHTRAYRNTSALVEAFTADYGRVSLVAKGAFRERSSLAAARQLFSEFELSWTGQGALKTLTAVQPTGPMRWLQGKALVSGLYLNELLVKLLDIEDAHPALFRHYTRVLAELANQVPAEECLRLFEKALVCEVGFGLDFTVAADGAELVPVCPEHLYCFDPDVGLSVVVGHQRQPGNQGAIKPPNRTVHSSQVSGRTLMALSQGRLDSVDLRREAKHFLQSMIQHCLGEKKLQSPRVWRAATAVKPHKV